MIRASGRGLSVCFASGCLRRSWTEVCGSSWIGPRLTWVHREGAIANRYSYLIAATMFERPLCPPPRSATVTKYK
jgi:hypothetical protein